MNVGELSPALVSSRMAADGLAVAIPPVTVRLRSPLRQVATQFHSLYADYVVADARDYADIDVRLVPAGGARRWLRPQVQFVVDGVMPFDPFPQDHALPLFEWGLNWVFSHRMHDHLVLHAAAVARGGRALLLPAWPGSGKSTLAASLASRGWRFFSDEFGLVKLDGGDVIPFVRPVALKNQSIAVMRAFDPHAFIGTSFPKTRKGTVAHLRAPAESVRRAREPARVGAVVFPDFEAGAEASMRRIDKATAFLKLAGNAFNYEVVGERGFKAVAAIIRGCESYILRYGDLDAAHAAIEGVMGDRA